MWSGFMNAKKIQMLSLVMLGSLVAACSGGDLENANRCPKTNEQWNSKKNKCVLQASENILLEGASEEKAAIPKRSITPAPIDVEFLSYLHKESAFTLAVDVADFSDALGTKAAYEGVSLKFLGGWKVGKDHPLVHTSAQLSNAKKPEIEGCAAVPKAWEIGFSLEVKDKKLVLRAEDEYLGGDDVLGKEEKDSLWKLFSVSDEKYEYLHINGHFTKQGEMPAAAEKKEPLIIGEKASRKCFKYIYEKQEGVDGYTAPEQLPGESQQERDALTVSADKDPAVPRLEISVGGKKLSDLKGGGLKYFLSALDVDVADLIKEDADKSAFKKVADELLKEATKVAKYCKNRLGDCTSIPAQ